METERLTSRPDPGLLATLGAGLKRVRAADETPDGTGFRTIWHHGPMKTDLFSFLDPDQSLHRQELVFLGLALAWTGPEGLVTGRTEDGPGPAVPGSLQVRYDAGAPDPQILMQATLLLRAAPHEDFYCLHLRKRVNEALAGLGVFRTDIRDLDPAFQAELRRLLEQVAEETAPVPAGEAAWTRSRRAALVLALAAAVGAGVALWVLLR